MADHQHHHHDAHGGAAPAVTAKDPVCGMDVDPETTPHRAEHAGDNYFFCSARCADRFKADPGKYLEPRPAASTASPGSTASSRC